MAIYQCPICNQKFESDKFPESCPIDGSENVEFKLIVEGLTKFSLRNDKDKILVYKNYSIGRSEIKSFFPILYDNDGNHIYKYCDRSNPMIVFDLTSDGVFEVSAPFITKNYFMIDRIKLEKKKFLVKEGNVLSLYSTSKKKIVAEFKVSS